MLRIPQSMLGAGGFGQPQPQRIEFRAGRCNFANGTVTPLKEKGRVSVFTDESGLTHFQWKSRQTNTVVDDFIIMPNDAEWAKVPQCTTGRVFLLDYGSDSSRHFYWMQEPSDEKDEQYFTAIKKIVCPEEEEAGGAGGGLGDAVAGELSQEQLLALLEEGQDSPVSVPQSSNAVPTPGHEVPSSNPHTPLPTDRTPLAAGTPLPMDFLQQALRSAAQTTPATPQQEDVSLTAVLKAEAVLPLVRDIMADPELKARLAPHLPESQTSDSAVEDLVRSPQFQQTLKTLTAALQSGQAAAVLASMGLNPQQAGPSGGVQALLRAIQAEADANRPQGMHVEEGSGGEEKPKEDEDEDMDLYG